MKFAMNAPQTIQLLPKGSTNDRRWFLSSFFFHDRGSAQQKNLKGMLQEVLFQILYNVPEAFSIVEATYTNLVQSQEKPHPQWDEKKLETCLYEVVNRDRYVGLLPYSTVGLLLFIDALDEHFRDQDRLVTIIKTMANQAATNKSALVLKVCLASRLGTIFQVAFQGLPSFAIRDYTKGDIERYAQDRLYGAFKRNRDEVT